MLSAAIVIAGGAGIAAGTTDEVSDLYAAHNPRLWSAFAGGASRVSPAWSGARGPNSIATPRWVKNGDDIETFTFYGQTGVVTSEDLVIAIGYLTGYGDHPGTPPSPRTHDTLVAFSRLDGSVVWSAPVPVAALNSWSTPAVDTINRTVIVAAGTSLTAISLDDGSTSWTRDLGEPIVNASPAVTHDLLYGNRVFITNHSFGGNGAGKLYCVNASPYHPIFNRYQPGELLWSVDLGGHTSGSSPAYDEGVVYVTTATGGSQWDQGTVLAFRADATSAPAPLWRYQHDDPSGFFSGPAVKGNAVYASTYSFHGGQYSASTVRLNASNGVRRWSVPTNRTEITPVPLDGGLVLVSGGFASNTGLNPVFGSLPSLQLISENPTGTHATRLWDSAMDTLQDFNNNGHWDPGEPYVSLGGWTNQPIVRRDQNGRYIAYVGSAPAAGAGGFFAPSPSMWAVDLTKRPTQPGFAMQTAIACGGSPALTERELYAVGANGLHAFGAPSWSTPRIMSQWALRILPDLNGNGTLDGQDLWLALQHASDE